MWREVKRHRPGEEPPSGVALRVVHPVAGNVALDGRGELQALPAFCCHGDAVANRQDEPAVAPGNNRAYLLPDGERPQPRPRLVVSEDHAAGQVDEQQRPAPLVPMRRLAHIGAEVSENLNASTCGTAHALTVLADRRKQALRPRDARRGYEAAAVPLSLA